MKEIRLTDGSIALVSDKDYDKVKKFSWYNSNGYARTEMYDSRGNKQGVMMHRYILGLDKGNKLVVDHINHNTLDNTRSNIRACTQAQNQHNKNMSSRNKTGFKGVTKLASGKYIAQITIRYVPKKLGTFDTAKEAHKAYCKAAKEVYGKFANYGRNSVLVDSKISKTPQAVKKSQKKQTSDYGKINPFWRSSLPEYRNNLHNPKN